MPAHDPEQLAFLASLNQYWDLNKNNFLPFHLWFVKKSHLKERRFMCPSAIQIRQSVRGRHTFLDRGRDALEHLVRSKGIPFHMYDLPTFEKATDEERTVWSKDHMNIFQKVSLCWNLTLGQRINCDNVATVHHLLTIVHKEFMLLNNMNKSSDRNTNLRANALGLQTFLRHSLEHEAYVMPILQRPIVYPEVLELWHKKAEEGDVRYQSSKTDVHIPMKDVLAFLVKHKVIDPVL